MAKDPARGPPPQEDTTRNLRWYRAGAKGIAVIRLVAHRIGRGPSRNNTALDPDLVPQAWL